MWYLISGLVLIIYAVMHLAIRGPATYIAAPLLWLFLAYATLKMAGSRARIRLWRSSRSITITSASIAGFEIVVFVFAGIFTSFGESPYQFTPLFLVINTFFFMSNLIGVELSRAYLAQTCSKRKLTLALGLISLLYAAVSIPLATYTRLNPNSPLGLAEFSATTFLPALAESLLATYLALLGGPIASIAYRGILTSFEWLSPILPNPSGSIKAFIGVMAPTIGFLYISQTTTPTFLSRIGMPTETERRRRLTKTKKSSPVGWTIIFMLCVLMVWTSMGLLGFYPTIIASGSMRSTLDVGDIVIVVPVDPSKLHVGDIIQYRQEEEMIVHRVVETLQSGKTKLFTTKGDANNAPDQSPVFSSQIRGKVVFTIPKLGWIPIYFKAAIAGVWIFILVNTTLAYIVLTTIVLSASIYTFNAYRKRSNRRWQRGKS